MWWKTCAKSQKRGPVKNAKISKSGLFQTAGAAQPMEPWKKRRPFCRGKTMADHMSFVRKQPGGHGWAVKLSQSRVNLGILPAASFSKNSFFFQGWRKPPRGLDIGIPSAPANSRRPARPVWKCAKSGLGPPVSREITSNSGEKRWKKAASCQIFA